MKRTTNTKPWRTMTPTERLTALTRQAKARKRARQLGTWQAPTREQWHEWRAG